MQTRRLPESLGRAHGRGMSNIAELNKKLDQAIFTGRAMEAFEELYDDEVVMQENNDAEQRGKAHNRKREQDFFATIEQFHGGQVLASGHGGDVSFSESEMDVTLKGVGRITM